LQGLRCIFVFLVDEELDVLDLVCFVNDFLFQKSVELLALLLSLVILVHNLFSLLSQLFNDFVLGFSLFLDASHVFDSELYLVAKSVLQISVVHIAQVVNLLLCVFDLLYIPPLLIEEVLLSFVSQLFILSLNALEPFGLGHLWDMILKLMDHLDVFDQWLSFFFFFDWLQGFVTFLHSW